MSEKKFCAVNFKPVNRSAICGLEDEKNRNKKDPEWYKNKVDMSKIKDNVWLKRTDGWNQAITDKLEELGINERKNARVAINAVFRASTEWLEEQNLETRNNYWNDCLNWIKTQVNDFDKLHILNAVIHRDEIGEHLEVTYIPFIEKEYKKRGTKTTLCAKDHLRGGGKKALSEIQTEFAKAVGEKYGLERGKVRIGTDEQKKALSDLEYQEKVVKERVEKLKDQEITLETSVKDLSVEQERLRQGIEGYSDWKQELEDENWELTNQLKELEECEQLTDRIKQIKQRIEDVKQSIKSKISVITEPIRNAGISVISIFNSYRNSAWAGNISNYTNDFQKGLNSTWGDLADKKIYSKKTNYLYTQEIKLKIGFHKVLEEKIKPQLEKAHISQQNRTTRDRLTDRATKGSNAPKKDYRHPNRDAVAGSLEIGTSYKPGHSGRGSR